MKKTIATTFLLVTILVGGITACNRSNSSDVPQSNASQSQERTQKREAVRKQIEAVLTPEQVQQLQTKLQQGEKMRQALSSLNLTPDQKTKIQEIFKANYAQRQKQSKESSQ